MGEMPSGTSARLSGGMVAGALAYRSYPAASADPWVGSRADAFNLLTFKHGIDGGSMLVHIKRVGTAMSDVGMSQGKSSSLYVKG